MGNARRFLKGPGVNDREDARPEGAVLSGTGGYMRVWQILSDETVEERVVPTHDQARPRPLRKRPDVVFRAGDRDDVNTGIAHDDLDYRLRHLQAR